MTVGVTQNLGVTQQGSHDQASLAREHHHLVAAGTEPNISVAHRSRKGDGEFFQVYTHVFEGRFFFEFVQRRNYQSFGIPDAAIRLAAQAREVGPAEAATL
jgi:hypothetical protein